MILSDIQPHYFPRLHYFSRMLRSNVFVVRDEVQFVRNHRFPDGKRGPSYQAHTAINTATGRLLLSVSVKRADRLSIDQTELSDEQPWARKHLNVLKNSYWKSVNGPALLPELEGLLGNTFTSLGSLNTATIIWSLAHLLGIARVDPSQLSIPWLNSQILSTGRLPLRQIDQGSRLQCLHDLQRASATERIIALCEHYSASHYLAGHTAVEAYLDLRLFNERGIGLLLQDWNCPQYPQLQNGNGDFVANLSIIDLLMNVPPRKALDHLV